MTPVLFDSAFLVAMDDARTFGRASVLVDDGVIADMGAPDAMRARHPGAERLDMTDRLLMPGLVDAHLHPDMVLLKGMLEERDLHAWGGHDLFEDALAEIGSERWVQRAGIRASLVQAALSGTTCIATYGVTADAETLCAEALEELGLRGHITIRDITFGPVPDHLAGISAFYRLHAEESLTDRELTDAAGVHAAGGRVVMHAAETLHRVGLARHGFGTTTIRLLERYGLLSPRMLLSHAIQTDAEEWTLMAGAGAPVVVSPTAEMKLADGLAPVVDMLAAGVTVALGTDAAVCNNGSDMFLEMKQLGLSQKLRYGAHALPAEQILQIATRGGAAALGAGDVHGRIQPGWSADLIAIDLESLRMHPFVEGGRFENVHANLVYAATGQDVTDVMVKGRWVVRDRTLQTADPRQIRQELNRAAAALYDRITR